MGLFDTLVRKSTLYITACKAKKKKKKKDKFGHLTSVRIIYTCAGYQTHQDNFDSLQNRL